MSAGGATIYLGLALRITNFDFQSMQFRSGLEAYVVPLLLG